jgi:hypothetical protein
MPPAGAESTFTVVTFDAPSREPLTEYGPVAAPIACPSTYTS